MELETFKFMARRLSTLLKKRKYSIYYILVYLLKTPWIWDWLSLDFSFSLFLSFDSSSVKFDSALIDWFLEL